MVYEGYNHLLLTLLIFYLATPTVYSNVYLLHMETGHSKIHQSVSSHDDWPMSNLSELMQPKELQQSYYPSAHKKENEGFIPKPVAFYVFLYAPFSPSDGKNK